MLVLLANSADVMVAASEKYNMSVPPPPANTSDAPKPASVVLNVSALALPVMLTSTPAFMVTTPAALKVTAPVPPMTTALAAFTSLTSKLNVYVWLLSSSESLSAASTKASLIAAVLLAPNLITSIPVLFANSAVVIVAASEKSIVSVPVLPASVSAAAKFASVVKKILAFVLPVKLSVPLVSVKLLEAT